MKIVFMGTPDFAAGALKALIAAGHEIVLVVTQPDKRQGRSNTLVPSPVKSCALEHGLPVFQPQRIKLPEEVNELKKYNADLYVVAAFGQILSQEILDIPPYGCLNIHASLLPRYRGASPIQAAILQGEEKTGITIMQMDIGIDTGDILYQKEVDITKEDTFETLHDKLLQTGGEAIVSALSLLAEGKLVATRQNHQESSHTALITKDMGQIDFNQDVKVLDCFVRGMNPWPSAYTFYRGKQLKLWKAEPVEEAETKCKFSCGCVCNIGKDFFDVCCKGGSLRVYELQLEGKKRMSTHDFLLGIPLCVGDLLG